MNEALPPRNVRYGEPVEFTAGAVLEFDDFTLTFRGLSIGPGSYRQWPFTVRDSLVEREVVAYTGGDIEFPKWVCEGRCFELALLTTSAPLTLQITGP